MDCGNIVELEIELDNMVAIEDCDDANRISNILDKIKLRSLETQFLRAWTKCGFITMTETKLQIAYVLLKYAEQKLACSKLTENYPEAQRWYDLSVILKDRIMQIPEEID